jgi:hypothetical protein
MRELKRQGNAIEARQATVVATLVTLITKRKRKGDRQRQTATRATRATDFDRQSTRFRQRSVTMVTITKESPRATGRDNSGDRYRNKNKDKKQWRLGGELGGCRLDPTGDSIIAPCVGYHCGRKYPTQWRCSKKQKN